MSEKWDMTERYDRPEKVTEYADSGLWEFFQHGEWHVGSNQYNHRQHTELGGIPTRTLYFVKSMSAK